MRSRLCGTAGTGSTSLGAIAKVRCTAASVLAPLTSEKDRPTVSSSTSRSCRPSSRADFTMSWARPGTETVKVSKKAVVSTSCPAADSEAAARAARSWVRRAIARRPSGPW